MPSYESLRLDDDLPEGSATSQQRFSKLVEYFQAEERRKEPVYCDDYQKIRDTAKGGVEGSCSPTEGADPLRLNVEDEDYFREARYGAEEACYSAGKGRKPADKLPAELLKFSRYGGSPSNAVTARAIAWRHLEEMKRLAEEKRQRAEEADPLRIEDDIRLKEMIEETQMLQSVIAELQTKARLPAEELSAEDLRQIMILPRLQARLRNMKVEVVRRHEQLARGERRPQTLRSKELVYEKCLEAARLVGNGAALGVHAPPPSALRSRAPNAAYVLRSGRPLRRPPMTTGRAGSIQRSASVRDYRPTGMIHSFGSIRRPNSFASPSISDNSAAFTRIDSFFDNTKSAAKRVNSWIARDRLNEEVNWIAGLREYD